MSNCVYPSNLVARPPLGPSASGDSDTFTVEGAVSGLLVRDSPRPSDVARALHRQFDALTGFEPIGAPLQFEHIVTTIAERPAHRRERVRASRVWPCWPNSASTGS